MNIYKKTLVAVLGIGVAAFSTLDYTSIAHSNVAGAPIGRTGSPGDANLTCANSCHTGSAVTVTPGMITSNVPVTGYIPGATYTITATVSMAGINKYGFEISPQSTTGVQKGTCVITNATETRLLGTTAKYVTHKSAGTTGTGTKTWTFNWVAPAAGSGDAIFYGAFNAANGNASSSGDKIITSTLLISENLSAGILDVAKNSNQWTIYPNPSSDRITVESLDPTAQVEAITLYDLTGKRIKTVNYEVFDQSQSIDVADLPGGVYVLNIESGQTVFTKKFVKK